MKILIIRFSSIGDIVLTSPVVRCLKNQIQAEIHYLTKKNFENIVRSNPYIDKVFGFEKDIAEVLQDLKSEHYDLVIDLHKNLRSVRVRQALDVKTYSFNKLNIEKWLMVNLKINRLPYKHIVDRNLKTVAPLNIIDDGEGLDYFIPKKDEVNIENIGKQYDFSISNAQYIAFVIGAAHATKRLPVEKIIDICNKIKLPVIVLGGKEDSENGEIIVSKSIGYVLNLCGKLNLNQSASVVRQAHKVITHDTGLMHIAAAFRKNIISIWGNTIPEFGMYPYLPNGENSEKPMNVMIEVKGLNCRPCSKIGHEKCPKGHFKCMQMIDTDEVAILANSCF
jgi:ADP-heptose:LPS heptosyltransferase